MTIYVAEHGEDYEGSRIVGIYFQEADAIKAALAEECYRDGGWVKDEKFPNLWSNGRDWVAVHPWELQGEYLPEVWK